MLLSSEESAFWRDSYIETFVDASSEYYRKNIANPHEFSDGAHYVGYLWDCLRSPSRISDQRFGLELVRHPEVFVLADDHSRDLILGAPPWPYRALSVLRIQPYELLKSLDSFPEDIYAFDPSLSWTLVRTHEHDDKRRLCLGIGIEK